MAGCDPHKHRQNGSKGQTDERQIQRYMVSGYDN